MERKSGFIIVYTAKFKFRVEKYAPAGVVISKKCLKVLNPSITTTAVDEKQHSEWRVGVKIMFVVALAIY